MKTKYHLFVLFALLGGLVLSACGTGAAATPASQIEAAATQAPAIDELAVVNSSDAARQSGSAAPAPAGPLSVAAQNGGAAPVYNLGESPDPSGFASTHMIVKNAEVKLQVADSDRAIDGATQIVADLGGYMISSRVWYQPWADGKNYKYATVTIGVPVDQFEHMLSRLRGLAVEVLDETATGEDVSNQYVDLQSQLTNLQATRDRIKSFLDQAKTVDEALQVNQQLADVEGQIEQIQGQINYLHDRSAFSTVTVNFEPKLPDLVTPTPTPLGWNPGQTFEDAQKTVTHAYQGIVDLLIWLLVVFVPIFGPPLLILWALWKWFTRSIKKAA